MNYRSMRKTSRVTAWMLVVSCMLNASAVYAEPRAAAEAGRLGVSAVDHIFAITPTPWHEPIERFLDSTASDPAELDQALIPLAEEVPSTSITAPSVGLSDEASRFKNRYLKKGLSDQETFEMARQLAALNMVLEARGVSAYHRAALVAAVQLSSSRLPPDLNYVLGVDMQRIAAALGSLGDAAELNARVQSAGYRGASSWQSPDVPFRAALRRLRRLKRDRKILGEQARMPGYGMLGDSPDPGIIHLPNDVQIADSLYSRIDRTIGMIDSLQSVFPGINLLQKQHDRALRNRAFRRWLGLPF